MLHHGTEVFAEKLLALLQRSIRKRSASERRHTPDTTDESPRLLVKEVAVAKLTFEQTGHTAAQVYEHVPRLPHLQFRRDALE